MFKEYFHPEHRSQPWMLDGAAMYTSSNMGRSPLTPGTTPVASTARSSAFPRTFHYTSYVPLESHLQPICRSPLSSLILLRRQHTTLHILSSYTTRDLPHCSANTLWLNNGFCELFCDCYHMFRPSFPILSTKSLEFPF